MEKIDKPKIGQEMGPNEVGPENSTDDYRPGGG